MFLFNKLASRRRRKSVSLKRNMEKFIFRSAGGCFEINAAPRALEKTGMLAKASYNEKAIACNFFNLSVGGHSSESDEVVVALEN